jgi:hypothetical protein
MPDAEALAVPWPFSMAGASALCACVVSDSFRAADTFGFRAFCPARIVH